jgi:hypothetical protein
MLTGRSGRRADDLAQKAKRVGHGDRELDAPRLLHCGVM